MLAQQKSDVLETRAQQLLAEITAPPWHLSESHPVMRVHFSMPDGRESGVALSIGSTALQFRAPRQGSHRGERMVYRPFSEHDRANAEFIAAAPALVDSLLAALATARERQEAADELIGEMCETVRCEPEEVLETMQRIVWAQEKAEAVLATAQRSWQPIETAPKDGTWILAYGIDGSLQRVSWGRTRQNELQWCTSHGWCAFRYLMHWMPLPDPPSADARIISEQSEHTCHDMNPPFPYPCRACEIERSEKE